MSKDVEQTILQIIETFGERSNEEAQQYLENLKETERYRTDVY
jgi:sulfite reductase (NADPH) flavoprotein alpha-component